MECELLVRFLTKKMQKLRQNYTSFLATKHTESLRIVIIFFNEKGKTSGQHLSKFDQEYLAGWI
jgi:hypothetical protein